MKLAISTSRRPTPNVRRFANRLAAVLGADRVNRGKSSLSELAAELYAQGYTRLIVVDRKRGNPSRLRFYKLPGGAFGYITILGVRRLKPRFGRVDHYAFSGSSEAIGLIEEFLEGFPRSGRIGVTIEDRNRRISFRIRGKQYGVSFSWGKAVKEG